MRLVYIPCQRFACILLLSGSRHCRFNGYILFLCCVDDIVATPSTFFFRIIKFWFDDLNAKSTSKMFSTKYRNANKSILCMSVRLTYKFNFDIYFYWQRRQTHRCGECSLTNLRRRRLTLTLWNPININKLIKHTSEWDERMERAHTHTPSHSVARDEMRWISAFNRADCQKIQKYMNPPSASASSSSSSLPPPPPTHIY